MASWSVAGSQNQTENTLPPTSRGAVTDVIACGTVLLALALAPLHWTAALSSQSSRLYIDPNVQRTKHLTIWSRAQHSPLGANPTNKLPYLHTNVLGHVCIQQFPKTETARPQIDFTTLPITTEAPVSSIFNLDQSWFPKKAVSMRLGSNK